MKNRATGQEKARCPYCFTRARVRGELEHLPCPALFPRLWILPTVFPPRENVTMGGKS